MAIDVFIVSEVALHRQGIARLLSDREGVRLLGTADIEHALDALRELGDLLPDIVLLDMPVTALPTFALVLRSAMPQAKLVGIAVPEVEGRIMACAEAGICGYVTPSASVAELATAVECVARDELICSPRIAGHLIRYVAELASSKSAPAPDSLLTKREREVLDLIGQGLSNKEIAALLHIELATVKSHVRNIFEKLRIHRRVDAALIQRADATDWKGTSEGLP